MRDTPRASRQASFTCSRPPNSMRTRRRASSRSIPVFRYFSIWRSKMKRQLVFHVGFHGLAAEEGTHTTKQIVEHGKTPRLGPALGPRQPSVFAMSPLRLPVAG